MLVAIVVLYFIQEGDQWINLAGILATNYVKMFQISPAHTQSILVDTIMTTRWLTYVENFIEMCGTAKTYDINATDHVQGIIGSKIHIQNKLQAIPHNHPTLLYKL